MMKRILAGVLAGLAAPVVGAAQYTVDIQNLTRGIYVTPLLVAAHPSDTRLFELGAAASANLQAMAEGGDIAGLVTDLQAVGATIDQNPAGGLLAPGDSTTATLDTDGAAANTRLSLVGMMLPTNDGFVAVNAVELPTEPGTYRYDVVAHDAGTEGNDEIRGSGTPGQPGFPVPAPLDGVVGTGGSGFAASAEGYVHVHRGVIGDTDPNGGVSDIDSTLHRWLNPVLRVT
ncbi:MAG: spondin domain-containing protein, partial [Ectothiorhodospiraceae bacterium]